MLFLRSALWALGLLIIFAAGPSSGQSDSSQRNRLPRVLFRVGGILPGSEIPWDEGRWKLGEEYGVAFFPKLFSHPTLSLGVDLTYGRQRADSPLVGSYQFGVCEIAGRFDHPSDDSSLTFGAQFGIGPYIFSSNATTRDTSYSSFLRKPKKASGVTVRMSIGMNLADYVIASMVVARNGGPTYISICLTWILKLGMRAPTSQEE